ncbi:hypothetical protein ACKLNR_006176 [Fusarium oxysporum f. sp. zingiberi]
MSTSQVPFRKIYVQQTSLGPAYGSNIAQFVKFSPRLYIIVCSGLQSHARQGGYEKNLEVPTHQVSKKIGESILHKCNVSSGSQIEQLVSSTASTFDRLGIMVNNAGIFTGVENILEETKGDFDRTVSIHMKGTHFVCKSAIKQFLAREPPYCASKAAVVNLTRQLAGGFGSSRINIDATPYVQAFWSLPWLGRLLRVRLLTSLLMTALHGPVLALTQDVSDATLLLDRKAIR